MDVLLVGVVRLFAELLHDLHLGDLDLDLARQDLGHVDDLLHHLCLDVGHRLLSVLNERAGHLRDGVHHLNLLDLLWHFLHHRERHLLLDLLRLDDALPDFLVHVLDQRAGQVRLSLDGHHLRNLDGLLHLQGVRALHTLLVVSEVLLRIALVNVLDYGLRNLPHDLADLNLGHLHNPLLVNDVWDLDDLLDVLDLHSGHLLLHVLHLHARHLLHDLPDLHPGNLDDVLLHLHHGHLVDALDELVHRLLQQLLHLLKVARPWHLPGELHNLLLRHLLDLLLVSDLRDLDELLLNLDHGLLDVHDLALALLPGDLLHQVYDLNMRHLDKDLLVNHVRHLNSDLARLEDLDSDFLGPLLVLVARLLPHHLMRLHGGDLDDLLVRQLDDDRLLPVAHGNTWDLNDLLHLLDLMLVLHDRVLLHHLLPRHLLDHLVDHGPRDLVHNGLHRWPCKGQEVLAV
mmetsp:Transcript_79735/g.247275  ORF Transcript_79735/g.247275 Transcript_79735/m.247275 type:complete len:457 (+) Transcript_79735:1804-3174(+)